MAFGGFFGGSSSSSDDNNSSSSSTSTSSSPTPDASSLLSSSSSPSSSFSLNSPPTPTGSSSSETRQRIQLAIAQQANIANAKFLISKVNENCFATCIQTPSSSLSSKENQCLSSCMEKYIEAWNVTSRTYVGRLQKEGAALGVNVGAGTGPSSGL